LIDSTELYNYFTFGFPTVACNKDTCCKNAFVKDKSMRNNLDAPPVVARCMNKPFTIFSLIQFYFIKVTIGTVTTMNCQVLGFVILLDTIVKVLVW